MLIRKTIALLILASVMPWSTGSAQDSAAIDPMADQVLRQMSEYLSGLPHFRVEALVSEDVEIESGQLVVTGLNLDMVVRRPDRLWVDLSGDDGHRRLQYDGETVRLIDYTMGTVARAPAQEDIQTTVEYLIDNLGIVVPLAELAFDDPYAAGIANVETATYLGTRLVEGVEHHHLALTQETIDWEIWIANTGRPLPRKLLIRYKQEAGSPQFTAIISQWDLSSGAPDALFSAEAPVGFNRINFIETGGER
jgi:hypothetical protein